MWNEYEITLNSPATDRRPSSGTRTYTIEIQAEPIVFNLDPAALGRGPAKAIAAFIRERIASITTRASERTLQIRAAALRAYQRGSNEARQRYGNMEPNTSDKLLNDSGRLIRTISAVLDQTAATYRIFAGEDRLEPSTLHDSGAALAKIGDLLKEHVPELADPEALMSAPPVSKAVERAIRAAWRKVEQRHNDASIAVAAALADME